MPDDLYPNTDLGAAFLEVGVDISVTPEVCNPSSAAKESSHSEPKNYPPEKIGKNLFTKTADGNVGLGHQAYSEHYHIFRNRACYELLLGVVTNGYGAVDGITKVDDDAVIRRLKAVIATAEFHPTTITPPKLSMYMNRTYGFSFEHPKDWRWREGAEAQLPVHKALPHGVTVASVEIPSDSYPGTDFKAAFLSVIVDSSLTPDECARFAFADPVLKRGNPPNAKIGATEFAQANDGDAGLGHEGAAAHYYHAFRNGACYEFILGQSTVGLGAVEGMKKVDDNAVLERLKEILVTVRFYPATVARQRSE